MHRLTTTILIYIYIIAASCVTTHTLSLQWNSKVLETMEPKTFSSYQNYFPKSSDCRKTSFGVICNDDYINLINKFGIEVSSRSSREKISHRDTSYQLGKHGNLLLGLALLNLATMRTVIESKGAVTNDTSDVCKFVVQEYESDEITIDCDMIDYLIPPLKSVEAEANKSDNKNTGNNCEIEKSNNFIDFNDKDSSYVIVNGTLVPMERNKPKKNDVPVADTKTNFILSPDGRILNAEENLKMHDVENDLEALKPSTSNIITTEVTTEPHTMDEDIIDNESSTILDNISENGEYMNGQQCYVLRLSKEKKTQKNISCESLLSLQEAFISNAAICIMESVLTITILSSLFIFKVL